MSDDATHDDTTEEPSLMQRVHAATGDRDAEAAELEKQAPDGVDADDAKIAVQRAHGEAGADQPMPDAEERDEALALPTDVEDVHEERTS